jgi:serine/threonine protein kinase
MILVDYRMHELIGTNLGQYEITAHIAKGGMATVYLARQASMNRDVAIKILPSDFTHDETFLRRFYLEVEVIAGLQHPHILPVYDFGTHENQPYIVMAYLNGGTLADKMSDGLTAIDETIRITHQVAEALDFAHSKGIIHRDFKPANVLLDEQQNAYLADFGLAKLTESDQSGTQLNFVGTPTYMAPEQAQSEQPTKAVDIYSLGVTLYEMLAGEVPYQAPSMTGVLIAHIREPIPDILLCRPDLPGQMQQFFETTLSKNAEERYESAGDLAQDLKARLQGSPSSDTEIAEIAPQQALLMTNMLGHVIFVDNQCLNLLKRHHNEARTIVGKAIHDVIGIDEQLAKQLLGIISSQGQIDSIELEITNSRGHPLAVICSAMATRDDKGDFVGADITLLPLPKVSDGSPSSSFQTAQPSVNTQEKNYLQSYFINQLESLCLLSSNWGGKRVADQFENIINETGQRNVWPISMKNGKIEVELKETDVDMYKALVARGIAYAAHILGEKQVIKEMEYVNKNTEPNILIFVQTLGLDKLYSDILD